MKCFFDKTHEDVSYRRTLERTVSPYQLQKLGPIPKGIPEEFRLYLSGAIAWRARQWGEASSHWIRLLRMSPESRRYRSTWATFMLGKTHMIRDAEGASHLFERTRQLAAEGFKDSLGLAVESLGWQALTEKEAGNFAQAIHLYYEFFSQGDGNQRFHAGKSIRLLLQETVCQDYRLGLDWVSDPLITQIVAAYVNYTHYCPRENIVKWLKAVRESGGTLPDRQAERLAWAAYRSGDVEAARYWIDNMNQPSSVAKWILAKILLREGEFQDAVEILDSIRDTIRASEEDWDTWGDYYHQWHDIGPSPKKVNRELGVIKLGLGSYEDALEAFLRAEWWLDAAYVAERIMTSSELEGYLKRLSEDSTRKNRVPSSYPIRLHRLLLRRYVREQNWDKVQEYCLHGVCGVYDGSARHDYQAGWKEVLDQYRDHLRAAEDELLDDRGRANHFFKAGVLLRKYGRTIASTEVEPDYGGSWHSPFDRSETIPQMASRRLSPDARHASQLLHYALPSQNRSAAEIASGLGRMLTATADERARVAASGPKPYRWRHYHYVAADYAWRASQLLEDDDPLLAEVLYYGGSWIKYLDPKTADKFYKALVNRCRRLAFAQEADRIRWFPKKPPAVLELDDEEYIPHF
jgi:hypothetical protein